MSEEEVLTFWFGKPGDPWFGKARPEWWRRDESFDARIRERFSDLHSRIVNGEHAEWLDRPRAALAYVIVLDQFSRNLHRNDPRAFAADARAREAATHALDRGFDRDLTLVERPFLYMPFMHSEDLADQNRCVELFEQLARDDPTTDQRKFAERHREIIQRFGRFPHRNPVLGRETTPEEAQFLKEPNSSF